MSTTNPAFAPSVPQVPMLHAWVRSGDRIVGTVYRHPDREDGRLLATGPVMWVADRYAFCEDAWYRLGSPA